MKYKDNLLFRLQLWGAEAYRAAGLGYRTTSPAYTMMQTPSVKKRSQSIRKLFYPSATETRSKRGITPKIEFTAKEFRETDRFVKLLEKEHPALAAFVIAVYRDYPSYTAQQHQTALGIGKTTYYKNKKQIVKRYESYLDYLYDVNRENPAMMRVWTI